MKQKSQTSFIQSEKTWPASKVEMWTIDKIKPFPNNPRTHPEEQILTLAQSMMDDGVTFPILVDEQGIIIAGHGRRLAALQNGFTKFPVVVAKGWSEQKKRAARLKDNSIGLQSGWDKKLLRLELHELMLDKYDMKLLGFQEFQLVSFMAGPPSENDCEAAPELPEQPVSQLGDLWVLGRHRILCGDSTKVDDVNRALDGAKPKLMVTDPPYGVDYDPSWRAKAGVNKNKAKLGEVKNDDRADWTEAWLLFSGDVAYVWHGGLHSGSVEQSLVNSGFVTRAQIIWSKDRFALSRGDYHWRHEPCWYAVRVGKAGGWQGDRKQDTVWNIPAREDGGHGHGTQKPVECMRRPIENNSKPGDVIYEPFSGSGTTIIAAEMTTRSCRAIELSPTYVDVCVRRWQTFASGEATLAGDGRTFAQISAERLKTGKAPKRAKSDSGKPVRRGKRDKMDDRTMA